MPEYNGKSQLLSNLLHSWHTFYLDKHVSETILA